MKRAWSAPVLLALVLAATTTVTAQPDYTPRSLTLTVFSDGTTKTEYLVMSDPDKVRVDVELFGPPFSNLVIRDEEGNPLGSSVRGGNVTVDSIGATELRFIYFTNSLTAKEGPIWSINVSAPVETVIILPKGASFFDMSSIPLDFGELGDKQYIEFNPGEISVYYLIGLPSLEEEAEISIEKAEAYIAQKESESYIMAGARALLNESKSLFDSGQFLESKNNADDALDIGLNIVESADSAASELEKAQAALSHARSVGRTEGLATAESAFTSAQELFDAGSYRNAESAALQAYELALTASKPRENSLLYFGVVLGAIISAGGFLYIRRGKQSLEPIQDPQRVQLNQKEYALEALFGENNVLRREEKEVLKFLLDSGGEAFASEIRARFELPRASAWRLIKRLVNHGIVEETRVGNQSQIRIRR